MIRKKSLSERRKYQVLAIMLLLSLLLAIFAIIFIIVNNSLHFKRGTTINGINCSKLSVQQAYEKVEEEINNQVIFITFPDSTQVIDVAKLDLQLNIDDFSDFLEQQKQNKDLNFELPFLQFNKTVIEEAISSYIDMQNFQDAYLKLGDDNLFCIIPESGYSIELNEALSTIYDKIEGGIWHIDLKDICNFPTITADQLTDKQNQLNFILSTDISFELPNNQTISLDSSVIKNWIIDNGDGDFSIDIDSNLPLFVQDLAELSAYTITKNVTATNLETEIYSENITVNLNQEAEIQQIKSELGTTINDKLVYEDYDDSEISDYVEIDLSRQNVWMYIDGECIVDTPCVTGSVAGGHATPPGSFHLTYKTTNTYLNGTNNDGSKYHSYVNYWMPFNGGIGLHDASWRNKFGGTIYRKNGSHGCINLPYSAAKTIYENIDNIMPIIVYKSSDE